MLKVAWERRLTFTVSTSVTTGIADTVVWNEIHHKTESNSNHSGHGYPDPHYLDRVLLELAAQGVEDGKEEEEDVASSSSDDSSSEEDEDKDDGKRGKMARQTSKTKSKPKSTPKGEVIDISSSDSL